MQDTIPKTGFLVSVTSYVVFWLLDSVRPGFVARYFSVHLFLLSALLFGIWWVKCDQPHLDHPRMHVLVAAALGILLATLVWISGEGFGSLRILVTGVVLFIPLLVLRLVKYK